MAMASRASVTVSMAAEMMGIERLHRPRQPRCRLHLGGSTEEAPGFISTSSKVRYSGMWRGMGQPLKRKWTRGEDWRLSLTPVRRRGQGPALANTPVLTTISLDMISQRARYAFKAVVALARAKPGEGLQIRQLCEQEKLPRKFLEQILLIAEGGGLHHQPARPRRRL